MFFRKKKSSNNREVSQFLETGFHGDLYLQKIINSLMSECEYFVETGTNVGSTLAYVARTYPKIKCLSCEPHKESYFEARNNISENSNAEVFNMNSLEFINAIEQKNIISNTTMFWLDAHGFGFEWPLKKEIEFITSCYKKAYVLIDDFKVPNNKNFKWDEYNGQTCSFEYIKDSIHPECKYSVYYPVYSEKTSRVHPLIGWGLIVIGIEELKLSDNLNNLVKKEINSNDG